ncbi:Glutaredoxin domain protein [Mycena indigotica]|uniref:Glutaredoxin domain protein n=1 Tax=Mycena indigotica TaxID=2126181 RepID=A0A8H6W0C8_9AGAR|nr:Glutaredoxin domain protein [Mycena indigotica]KAF7294759.1 Glutaredoxin domain protein [Mycena indigotica]
MEPKRTTLSSRLRRRRLLIAVLVLLGVVYLFGFPSFALDAFDLDLDFPVNRANIAQLVRSKTKNVQVQVPEIYGLLHLVTSADTEDQHIMAGTFDPTKPVDMQVYASGKTNLDWAQRKREIDEQFPLVVFSKTYCPFSKRAKALLETYHLTPPPKVIEVDLRDDAEHIKQLLTRLTQHSTFPNVILLGDSLGGSDQLQALHKDGRQLRNMLQTAGIGVGNTDA